MTDGGAPGNGNGNWKTIGAVVGAIIGIAGLMNQKVDGLYAMLNQKIDERMASVNLRAEDARTFAHECRQWQQDYIRGLIPSAAEPALAAVKEKFAEVETQFRAFKERMLENEQLMKERTDRNVAEITELRVRLRETREVQARRAGHDDALSGRPLKGD